MKLEQRVSRCPACGGAYSSRIAHKDRYGLDACFSYCFRCSFIYLNPRPTQEEYDIFYEAAYRDLIKQYRGEQDLETNQYRYGVALARFLDDCGLRFHSILDIGGSTGIIADEVRKTHNGCDVTVVDPNERELAKARARGFRTINSSVERYEIKKGEYDLVLMCRAIDHVVEPLKVAQKISEAIDGAGLCYMDHCDWLLVARSEGFTSSLHVDHPSNFTRESFGRLLENAQLAPISEYIPPNSSCYGHLLERRFSKYHLHDGVNMIGEIRRLQAAERRFDRA